MWDLPGPGIEPVSPALAGGFLTTVPPGREVLIFSISNVISSLAHGLFRNVSFNLATFGSILDYLLLFIFNLIICGQQTYIV